MLPRQILDPFLKPFLEDIADSFINGFAIPISKPRNIGTFVLPEEIIVRMVLILMTGDHPAQCETGKFLNQDKAGCRRCHVIGKLSENPGNNRVYYGDNRYHNRYESAKRILEEEIDNMLKIEREDRVTTKKTLSSHLGFTGMSLFHKYLYPLYGFNVLTDFVYDVFHTIPLNLVKNVLEELLKNNIVNTEQLDKLLLSFPWTPELRDGRIPKAIKKD